MPKVDVVLHCPNCTAIVTAGFEYELDAGVVRGEDKPVRCPCGHEFWVVEKEDGLRRALKRETNKARPHYRV